MGNHKSRVSKSCLNCGSFVENRFCPKCGQENIESRQSFHHLFTHFASDLLHYDSSFWKTLKSLFFSPGKLSIEYMNGKRKSFLNPFSLYIFISFITFLTPGLLPDKVDEKTSETTKVVDKIKLGFADKNLNMNQFDMGHPYGKISSIEQLDSIHNTLPDNEKYSTAKYQSTKLLLSIIIGKDKKSKLEHTVSFIVHNLSKVLFFYMPIFAFLLWIFFYRSRKHYFDSGIYTLHFFSFTLALITLIILLNYFSDMFNISDILTSLLTIGSIGYLTFYFIRGNRNFYGQNRIISNIKSGTLVIVNFFLIIMVSLAYVSLALWLKFT